MEEYKIALEKSLEIIEEAKDIHSDFHSNHAGETIATGERSVDYVLYCVDLTDNYFLLIDFVDFGFEDFSIVHAPHGTEITRMIREVK